jgi:5-methylcytosine-specific restriction endonuclease McrA
VRKRNSDPVSSPGPIKLPVKEGQIEAARETLRENKGAQWSACFSAGVQVGGNLELRNNLIPLLIELDVPTATISDMFGLSGREVWAVAASEPISVFRCLDCGELLVVRDRRDLMRLVRALRDISCARAGDPGDVTLLCDSCTELRLQLHNEEQRLRRLAQQARTAQLRKMPFAEYRKQPEWQVRRVQALTRARFRCQMGSSRDAPLDVHHNSYQNYGDEKPEDLVVLCRSCHQKFHGVVEDAS